MRLSLSGFLKISSGLHFKINCFVQSLADVKKDATVEVPLTGCTGAALFGAAKRYIYTYEINIELLTEIRTPHPWPDFFWFSKEFC